MIYVLNKDGKPLMPTNRHGKVRKLLKQGLAKVKQVKPFFQIQLLYDSENYVQESTLKIDSGYTYIGVSVVNETKEFVSAEVELLSGIKNRLEERRQYRNIRRSRLRYRKPRFNNRKRSEGWLAPSIQHKYDSHIRIINKMKNLVPIKDTIVEVAAFDTHKIKNPNVEGVGYQQGDKQGFWNIREYVLHRDNHKCQHPTCKNKSESPILEVHHFKYWTGSKTDNADELITLCNKCHSSKNHQPKGILHGWMPKVSKVLKEAAYMSIVRWKLVNELNCKYSYGYITKSNRIAAHLEKSHANDAFCIESVGNQTKVETIYLQQVRKNNRSLELFYDAKYIDIRTGEKATGKDLFSGRSSRNKNHNSENLHKYRGNKLSKGRRSIRTERYSIQPQDIVLYDNQKYSVRGIQNKGAYVRLHNLKKVPKVSDVKVLYYRKSFVITTKEKKKVS